MATTIICFTVGLVIVIREIGKDINSKRLYLNTQTIDDTEAKNYFLSLKEVERW